MNARMDQAKLVTNCFENIAHLEYIAKNNGESKRSENK